MMAKVFTNKYLLLMQKYNQIEYDIKYNNKQPIKEEYEKILEELNKLYAFMKSAPDFMESNEIIENFVSALHSALIKSIRKIDANYGVIKM